MPFRMSRLVLQPRISTSTDCIVGWVLVGDGRAGIIVGVGSAESVVEEGVDGLPVSLGVGVKSNTGGGMMNGVAVTMAGVLDGMGDWTGNGWGATPPMSQDERRKARKKPMMKMFLILRL